MTLPPSCVILSCVILRLIADMPILGSANLPASIVDKYGEDVRKAVVSPFLLIYEIQGDEARMLGLMHEREAY